MQSFHLARGHAQFLGYFDGINSHPLQVIVGGVVLGFDGQRQRFNGAQVQSGHLLHVALLVFKFSQIQPIRAVNQVDDGHDEQRSFPSELAVEPADHPGEGRAHQVIRERPEIAFHPDPLDRLLFGERDHRGDGTGIGREVSDGRQSQQQRMALDLSAGYRQVIDVVCHGDRHGARRQVECDLQRAGAIPIETLHQNGRSGQSQRLRKTQFQYAQQDEQEVHRHGAGDAGQPDFQPGRQNRDQQVTDELSDVPAGGRMAP